MLKKADQDNDGFVSQEEFYQLISQYGLWSPKNTLCSLKRTIKC